MSTSSSLQLSTVLVALVVVSGGALAVAGAGGDVSAAVGGLDVGPFGAEEREEPNEAFRVSNLTESVDIKADGELVLTADVTNEGETRRTRTLELTLDRDGDGQPESLEDEQRVTLGEGETETATFSISTGDLETGQYAYAIESEHLEASQTLDLSVTHPPEFRIESVSGAETIVRGESGSIDAEISNVGDLRGGQTVGIAVDLDRDGTFEREESVDNVALNIAPGSTTTAEFDVESDRLEPGTYEYRVSTRSESETGEFRVVRPASFRITSVDAPEAVVRGDVAAVSASVTNVGDVAGTQEIEIEASSGVSVRTIAASDEPLDRDATGFELNATGSGSNATTESESHVTAESGLNASTDSEPNTTSAQSNASVETVSIESGESTTVRAVVMTDAASAGNYSYAVRTGDDARERTLTVRDAEFRVVEVDAPATPEVGESFTASATIRNRGDANGTELVWLGLDVDGDAKPDAVGIDRSVELGAGEETTVEFEVPTESDGLGGVTEDLQEEDYVYGVFTEDDNATDVVSLKRSTGGSSTTQSGSGGNDATRSRASLDEITQSKYGLYFDEVSGETKDQLREIYERQPFAGDLALTEVQTREEIVTGGPAGEFEFTELDVETQQEIEAEYDAQFQAETGDSIESWEEIAQETYGSSFDELTEEEKQNVKQEYQQQFEE